MNRIKYIVYEYGPADNPVMVIFPSMVAHGDVRVRGKPVSAGFIYFDEGNPVCHGRSESLRVNSRPQDTRLAYWTLGLPYRSTVDN